MDSDINAALAAEIEANRKFRADQEQRVRDLETRAARPGGPGVAPANPEHAKALETFLRTGDAGALREQQKAMSVGVSAEGGYTVPQDLERQIFEMARNASPLLGLVRNVPAAQDNHEIVVNLSGTATAWAAETGARAASTAPSFAKVTLASGEVWANPQVTQRLLDDAGFNVQSWLAGEIGTVFGQAIDAALASGTGTNQPRGLLTPTFAATADGARAFGTVERLHSGTSASFDADDLIDLEAKLKPQYRAKATWLMCASTWSFVRKLKDSTSNYLVGTLGGGAAPQLLGHPVVLDENIPAMAASSYSVLLGDFQAAYTVGNIRGVRILPDPYTAKPYVHFYSTQRIGGNVVDSTAYKALYLAV